MWVANNLGVTSLSPPPPPLFLPAPQEKRGFRF